VLSMRRPAADCIAAVGGCCFGALYVVSICTCMMLAPALVMTRRGGVHQDSPGFCQDAHVTINVASPAHSKLPATPLPLYRPNSPSTAPSALASCTLVDATLPRPVRHWSSSAKPQPALLAFPDFTSLPTSSPRTSSSPTPKHTPTVPRGLHTNTPPTCLKYNLGLREAGALPVAAEAATHHEARENRQTATAHRQPSTHRPRQASWQSLRSATKGSCPC
jgi:hypothetical protein